MPSKLSPEVREKKHRIRQLVRGAENNVLFWARKGDDERLREAVGTLRRRVFYEYTFDRAYGLR